MPLLPAASDLAVGTSIGWLGFPGIARNTLCFFCGTVSAVQHFDTRSFLVDGVAINGVSGGPVIYHSTPDKAIFVVGVLSAYMPNRQHGEALPGLSVAQDVSHFHSVLQTIQGFDEAKRTKQELETTEEGS